MPDWVTAYAALWGLLALPVMVLAAFPAIAQLRMTVRDRGRSPEEIHASLVATNGRVSGTRRRATLADAGDLLPISVTTGQGKMAATEYAYDHTNRGKSLLIVGDAGSGKSQIVADLHRISYKRAMSHADPLVEVVELVELFGRARLLMRSGVGPDVLRGAVRVIAARYRLSRQAVRRLIVEAKLIIAFDGLDELPETDRRAVASQIAAYALERPVILTTRPSISRAETTNSSENPLSALLGSPIQRVEVDLLAWSDVSAEFARLGIPVPNSRTTPSARRRLCTPLQFQILVFLWRRKAISETELARLLHEPDDLVPLLVAGRTSPGRDRALSLSAVLLADHGNDTDGTFRIFPLELGGWAFRIAKALAVVPFVTYGLRSGALVTAPLIAISILLSSPYPNSIWATRAANGWTGRIGDRSMYFGTVVVSVILVHVCRILSWSIQAKEPLLGDWSDFADIHWVSLAFWVWTFLAASPFSRYTNIVAWGHMERRSWLQFVFFGALTLITLSGWTESGGPLFAAWAYVGTGCLYWLVGLSFAWLITRTAPWHWGRLLDELVGRGILTRNADKLRFVHSSIRLQVVRSLAEDAETPPLLWKTFGAHWPVLLIEQGVGRMALRPNPDFEETVRRLAHRDAWSPVNVNAAICYYQWVALRNHESLLLLRRHLRNLPRSSLRTLLPDVLDRVGNARGLTLARAQLTHDLKSEFELHWPLRVVERYDDYRELTTLVDQLQTRYRDSLTFTTLLNARRLRYLIGQLGVRDTSSLREQLGVLTETLAPEELAMFALETNPPELVTAQGQLAMVEESALTMARMAQVMLLRGEPEMAREAAALAGTWLTGDVGYDGAIEVMLTIAMAGASQEAAAWLHRCATTGLRLRGRYGLRRNLGVIEGGAADVILCDLLIDPTPETASP